MWPLIIINSAEKAPVPLGLDSLDMFVTQTVARWNLLAAASLISAAPSLLLVIVLQRSFLRGIVIAGFGGLLGRARTQHKNWLVPLRPGHSPGCARTGCATLDMWGL